MWIRGLWERQWLEKWIGNHFQRGGIQKCGSGQKHLPWLWSWNIPIWQANWPKVTLVWAECMSLPYYSWFLKGLTSSGESQVYFPTTALGWLFLQAVCCSPRSLKQVVQFQFWAAAQWGSRLQQRQGETRADPEVCIPPKSDLKLRAQLLRINQLTTKYISSCEGGLAAVLLGHGWTRDPPSGVVL